MALKAFISGCSDVRLSFEEKRFFARQRPCGLILFRRNCQTPEQIRALTSEFFQALGDDRALVLIDQEGGRVQRLGPPNWRRYPPARAFGLIHERNAERGLSAAYHCARLMAQELRSTGVNVDCAPVLDVPFPGAHDIIGDRAFSPAPETVAALGRSAAQGLLDGGVLPVIKHIPGHGRALADSHVSLPMITAPLARLQGVDFVPFARLADLPLAMTAHVLIPELDPERPASASPRIIEEVIRRQIGFDGLLMCDDIDMGALSGPVEERAGAVLAAGCDIALHCSGDMTDMEKVAAVTPELAGRAAGRFERALGRLAAPSDGFDEPAALALLVEALAAAASIA
jgi:beta-N-acetylhexosaminidase